MESIARPLLQASPVAQPRVPRTLSSGKLKRAQRLHSQAVVVVIVLGISLAIGLAALGYPPDSTDLGIFLVSTVLVGLGGSVGFHRHFTHRSFKAKTPVRVALAILGSMAMQGTLFFWVALHRRHHEHGDETGDPHSPHIREDGSAYASRLQGVWHSYMGWTFSHEVPNAAHYAKDLLADKVLSRINRMYFLWVFLGLALPTLAGGLLTGTWVGALSGLVWGGFLRIFFWHNMIWYITSLAHVIGRRDFRSGDLSTNSVLMALPTLGESWHNNHHAFPAAPILHLKWYQFDFSGLIIRILALLGLAWDLKEPSRQMLRDKAQDPSGSLSGTKKGAI
ncbi:acyl-CoA desaturase [Sorangium sp. So ce1078]|uniref:acyl-CoA desaturase n=1 Tax=Sorangium sp. So ce1078 TaxID=3133329 RepID=UPI003F5E9C1D